MSLRILSAASLSYDERRVEGVVQAGDEMDAPGHG
jgi:hypothetical protein